MYPLTGVALLALFVEARLLATLTAQGHHQQTDNNNDCHRAKARQALIGTPAVRLA
jgi:hypothetical protein